MAPPIPPTAKRIIDSATLENSGSRHGSLPIQSSRPVAPCMRPATSIDAVTVNAVMKLGNRIAKVRNVCSSFQPADTPGSMNWWWKPTGVENRMNRTKTRRASGSLNSLPRVAGGKLFSDPLARLVFVLFILFSTPVGFHHQFMDPGVSAGWKLLHTFLTFAILFPSFITAFTVTASMEVAGRMRGATGLVDWIGKLPWRDPLFSSVALSMILFAVGGIGGAINASFGMNAVVHNTAFIQGHFHLTVGSAVALTFMGAAYWLLPRLSGRELELGLLARVQPYLWFIGMTLFSFSNHITGLMGMPRRIYDASYGGSTIAAAWKGLTGVSAVGGLFLFASAGFFMLVMIGTGLAGKRTPAQPIEWAEPLHPVAARRTWLDRYWVWTAAAIGLVLIAYAYPLWVHLQMPRYGSPGFKPF